jgi:hypothetical protein
MMPLNFATLFTTIEELTVSLTITPRQACACLLRQ